MEAIQYDWFCKLNCFKNGKCTEPLIPEEEKIAYGLGGKLDEDKIYLLHLMRPPEDCSGCEYFRGGKPESLGIGKMPRNLRG